jgi:hypothetical protein
MAYIGTQPANQVIDSTLIADGTVTTADIADSAITTAKIAAGAVVEADIADGAVTNAKIAAMAASKLTGQVPRANASSGSVIQVVSTTKTDTASGTNLMSSDSWSSALSVSITPTSSSSKILVMYSINFGGTDSSGDASVVTRLVRNSTAIAIGDASSNRKRTTTGTQFPSRVDLHGQHSMSFLDSPATTSSTTYAVQLACRGVGGNTWYVNRSQQDSDEIETTRPVSTITVMEIAA